MAAITDVMTPNPVSCSPDASLREVANLMVQHDCGQIPVVDDAGAPLGVVTDRDIVVRAVATGRELPACTAGDVMTTPCRSIGAGTSVQDAVALMEAGKIRRVPVVGDDGRLVGIVSIADLSLAGKAEATAQVVRQVSEPGDR
ncbi:MAG: CBS domain-containing protein [Lysobacteraceae bacterium]|nr:MAG: CBS domain-containing protein [Xanthomonadaceae bacterium]